MHSALKFTILGVYLLFLNYGMCENNSNLMDKSYATSVTGMQQLLETEQMLIDEVDKFTQMHKAKIKLLKNLLDILTAENDKAMLNPEEYLYNPLNAYSLMRRMYYDWQNIELYIKAKTEYPFDLKIIQSLRPKMPSTLDMNDASEAIYRLQYTYDLKAEDLARGIINGIQYGKNIKAIDCFYMASHLYTMEDYYEAGMWITQTLQRYVKSDYESILDFDEEKIWSLSANILLKQNRFRDALNSINKAAELKPKDVTIMKLRNDIDSVAKVNMSEEVKFETTPPTAYQLACRGAFSQIPSRFYCIYNSTTSAFLRLAPLKMEIIHLDPYIVLYHDVITDSEIKELQEMSKPRLERAAVYDVVDEISVTDNGRTSQFSWLENNASSATIRISRRIEDMTGFDVKGSDGSEGFQIMNYGIGGHFELHYDFFDTPDTKEIVRENGDRIATVLFYLSDVEQGGATAFPLIEKAIFPRKGTAVIFYDLNNKLEGDELTLHAACPVLYGSKWVCNIWIRSKSQIFRKPCYYI